MVKISELINGMIEKALKGSVIISPRFSDYRVADVLTTETVDFEREIEDLIKKQNSNIKKQDKAQNIDPKIKKDLELTKEKIFRFEKGNLGDIQKLSSEQFGNIKQLASDPFSFVTRVMLKKLRSGLGVLFVITIATEVIKFFVQEMFKPGRPFDIRFRERIDSQIIKFLDRKEQEELRQGHKSLITTTLGSLRGNALQGQIGGNFYTPGRFPINIIPPKPTKKINLSTGPGGINNPHNKKKVHHGQ